MSRSAEQSGHPPQKHLITVARAARLAEGAEGVRAVLRTAAARPGISTRELAAAVLIAVPTVAAVCGELRKMHLLGPKGQGVRLTDRGEAFVPDGLGILTTDLAKLDAQEAAILERFEPWAMRRPAPDFALDQSKALPESVVRRTLFAYRDDGIEGRSICLLGDDDFNSVAIALAHRLLTGGRWSIRRLVVLEKDTRILGMIEAAAGELALPIEVMEADLALPLPPKLIDDFDVVLTDPPYTVPGALLFLSRATELLQPGPGRRCYFSFGHKPPDETLELMRALGDLGLVPVELLPRFNTYEGASILGAISQLFSLRTTHAMTPVITGSYQGPLYTAEV